MDVENPTVKKHANGTGRIDDPRSRVGALSSDPRGRQKDFVGGDPHVQSV